ncbi:DUF2188 domain-containing protein [Arthrobacter crystallopoietes]|uniref:DUF2188 domain-containing protein n=1 Tax=Crystallibacter crystallopoietes TaxID=37928 RepID=A0A1H1HYK1_9MICC|nr:DUF2188 domain-containing protein [Arthrobacter crystallopoietes]AUI53660.1 hypothetical protein AC20117_22120 [Arthrobacter crystallopoietes]AUI53842.1 hypothetical protein AC20117_23210 [Arthrobacter crystallopoietes]SDR30156.1 hypothetical protein SAMN04489742_4770 [Arthrobacter crystallopoietes]
MTNPAIETYWEDDEWKNRRQGEDEPFAVAKTKEAAVELGRDAARIEQVEHIIKNQNGQIGERNSYGRDPRNIPG